jgi:hypothetical protein
MKALMGLLATVLTLSVSYYFAISLPAHNRAVLDFEREKYRTAQQEKKDKEAADKAVKDSADQELEVCTWTADSSYQAMLKSNGTPTGGGRFSIVTAVQTMIERQKTQALEECNREYERKTKIIR